MMSTNPIMNDTYYVRNLPHIQTSTLLRQLKSCVAGSSYGAMRSVSGLGGYCGSVVGLRSFRHYKSLMQVGLGVSTASTARRASVPAGNSKGGEMTTSVSERVVATDAPCIVKTKKLMAGREGVLSLAQGIVHWPPPQEALERGQSLVLEPGISGYGPADGLPELRDALREKLERENGLLEHDVMITAGANQAFTNVVLALVDECDPVVLFRPYYFNHLMALQMTGGAGSVVFGECDPATLHPDVEWLERAFASASPPKMVVVVNPCNPTGVLMSKQELDRVARLCGDHGAWLVVDNTYEHFCYEGREHYCPSGDHIVHLFSFSKAYGMMGWRVGYIAYPCSAAGGQLGAEILKVQDTIPICPTQLSQHVALTALQLGRAWVDERIAGLTGNREALIDALSPLGAPGCGVAGGEGAIYLWGKLPPGCEDDEAVVRWLVEKHGVCLIPGSSCGCPGFVRAAFANLQSDTCADASARLKAGLQELVAKGITTVAADLASNAAP